MRPHEEYNLVHSKNGRSDFIRNILVKRIEIEWRKNHTRIKDGYGGG